MCSKHFFVNSVIHIVSIITVIHSSPVQTVIYTTPMLHAIQLHYSLYFALSDSRLGIALRESRLGIVYLPSREPGGGGGVLFSTTTSSNECSDCHVAVFLSCDRMLVRMSARRRCAELGLMVCGPNDASKVLRLLVTSRPLRSSVCANPSSLEALRRISARSNVVRDPGACEIATVMLKSLKPSCMLSLL